MLSVLLFHVDKYSPILVIHNYHGIFSHLKSLLDPLTFGYHGVDLFFILSGFCLSYPTLELLKNSGQTNFDLASYLSRRFVRILPPYEIALFVFVLFLLGASLLGLKAPLDMSPRLSFVGIIRDALLLDRNTIHVNQSFWTLAIEFRWYFIFPIVLALWIRLPKAFLALIGLCMFASYFTHASSADVAYLPAFMLGIVAADVELKRLSIARHAWLLLIISLTGALAIPLPIGVPVSAPWQVAFFAFLVLAGQKKWIQRLLSFRPLSLIGLTSYSIYLVHQPIVATVVMFLQRKSIGALVTFSAATGIALAFGVLFWFVAERPFASGTLKKRLEGSLRPSIARVLRSLTIPERFALARRKETDSGRPLSPEGSH